MRKLSALGALCLVGWLCAAMAAPSAEVGSPAPAAMTISQAEAGIGRGGGEGGGGGSASQPAQKAAQLLGEWIARLLFVFTAIGIAVAGSQRNTGLAALIIVMALVIGAFVFAPSQVESWFKHIYSYVL